MSALTRSQINAATTAARTSSVKIWLGVIVPFGRLDNELTTRETVIGRCRFVYATQLKMQKFVYHAAVGIALALTMISLSACTPRDEDKTGNGVLENESAKYSLPSLPAVEPPLDRAAVLLAVDQAASAAALGRDDQAEQAKLDGKRIEVRIRFGCPEAASDVRDAPFQVRFSEADRTLRLRAAPDMSKETAIAQGAAEAESVEQVEGFWIRRPWLLEAACPVSRPANAQARQAKKDANSTANDDEPRDEAVQTVSLGVPRIGLAQYFTKQDSRLNRRDGRPYETTKVLADDEQLSQVGYNLVLAGRLKALPEGPVISCRPTSINQPPICIVFAQIDSVRIEQPDAGSVLAEWSRQ